MHIRRRRALRMGLVVVALGAGAASEALSGCSGTGSAGAGADASEASAAESSAPEGSTGGDAGLPPDATSMLDAISTFDATSMVDATLSDASPEASALDASDAADAPVDVFEAGGFDAGDCGVGPLGEPLGLACTGLYSDWPTKTIAPGLSPYTPGLVFWSDGATKKRWIYLPPGEKIDTSNMDEWTFPVGTRIWKEFSFPIGDGGAETRIETRLLWKRGAGDWYRTTYAWSPDGETSATELTQGELDAGGIGYEIPSQSMCNVCHEGRLDDVLGFEAVSLAAPGATGLTMSALEDAGLITAVPDASLAIPGDPVQAAALGWLHANCGTACHNSSTGYAETTGFWMRLDVATLGSVHATNTFTTGWNQPTVGFNIPGATTTYRFHACDTGSSCAYYRPDHRDGVDGTQSGTQMPPIDSHEVDSADVAKVAAWILDGCDAGD